MQGAAKPEGYLWLYGPTLQSDEVKSVIQLHPENPGKTTQHNSKQEGGTNVDSFLQRSRDKGQYSRDIEKGLKVGQQQT